MIHSVYCQCRISNICICDTETEKRIKEIVN